MRSGTFSILVFSRMCDSRFSATTYGARPTAVKPGRSSRPTESPAATSNGSPLIKPTARATASNTRHTIALTALAPTRHFNALQMAESPGSRLSLFPIRPYMERSMWTPTATFLLVLGAGAHHFAAFAQATRRSGARHRLSTETQLLASVAPSFRAG